jgi:hypothetical protein
MQKEEGIAVDYVLRVEETSREEANAEDGGAVEEGSNPDTSTGEAIEDAPLASREGHDKSQATSTTQEADGRDTQRDEKTASDDNLSDLTTDCLFNCIMAYALAHVRELVVNGELQLDEFIRLPMMRSKALQVFQQNEKMIKKFRWSANPVKDAATKVLADDIASCLMAVPVSILRDSEPEACSIVVFDDENSTHEIVYSIEVDTR